MKLEQQATDGRWRRRGGGSRRAGNHPGPSRQERIKATSERGRLAAVVFLQKEQVFSAVVVIRRLHFGKYIDDPSIYYSG